MLMVLCFGAAWPASIYRSVKARTAKGKSFPFLLIIFIGYIFGVAMKFTSGNPDYVVVFYFLNLIMVGTDMVLYFRNRNLDRKAQK